MSESGICAFDNISLAALVAATDVFDETLQESDRIAVAHGMADAIRRFAHKLFKLGDVRAATEVRSVECTTETREGGIVLANVDLSTHFTDSRICVRDIRVQLREPHEHVELRSDAIVSNGTGKFLWGAQMRVTLDIARAILVQRRISAVTPPPEDPHDRLIAEQEQELRNEQLLHQRKETVEAIMSVAPKRRRTATRISSRVLPRKNAKQTEKQAPPPSESLLRRVARYLFDRKYTSKDSTNYVEAYHGDESLFLF